MAENNHSSHISGIVKQLATPWNIALERAKRIADKNLGSGYILDLACGSGLQLAAYSLELNKPCIGIEIDAKRAIIAEKTIKNILKKEIHKDSKIICGDCLKIVDLDIKDDIKFSLIHLDPARPTNVQEHVISEMKPSPIEAIKVWNKLLAKNGGMILDLSPRLSMKQCKELEQKLNKVLPNLHKTWEWSSQGKGRVDRLSVWIGKVASNEMTSRYVRYHPKEINSIILEGEKLPWQSNYCELNHQEPQINDFISIIDPVLISSGLEDNWKNSRNYKGYWIRKEGRRPLFLHSDKLEMTSVNRSLIFESGQIKDIIEGDIHENIDRIVELAKKLEYMRLTLRLSIEPKLHPKIQSKIDKNLVNIGSSGFIIRLPNNAIAICSKI